MTSIIEQPTIIMFSSQPISNKSGSDNIRESIYDKPTPESCQRRAGASSSVKQDFHDRLENLPTASQGSMRIGGKKNRETPFRDNQPACRPVKVKCHISIRFKVTGQPLAARCRHPADSILTIDHELDIQVPAVMLNPCLLLAFPFVMREECKNAISINVVPTIIEAFIRGLLKELESPGKA
jgi:hypothetical protein